MASEAEELRREFDITRQELDEMAEEIALAESRMAEFARHDLQVGHLREVLDRTRHRHAELDARERRLRAKFQAVLAGAPGSTH
ncbi:hypothetical protein [Enterovirga aerilata]|uniref:Uncharacterized protein n=1 Tax=Enterovirga aerilata TaxID=2730920 RepID=A0A849IBC4_9HYPH|nr:hypothetical protein [Enterovirga sp. DB1703]NNM73340.1 hypothetical protein [Enterovirga sp. DB1703]